MQPLCCYSISSKAKSYGKSLDDMECVEGKKCKDSDQKKKKKKKKGFISIHPFGPLVPWHLRAFLSMLFSMTGI